MAQQLTNLQVKEVSLVGKGAIGERFTVMKSAGTPDPTPTPPAVTVQNETMLEKMVKAITNVFKGEVKKSDTSFNDVIQRQELANNFYDGYWVLEDVIWNVMEDDTITDKRAAIGTAVDQFKAYVLNSFDALNLQKNDDIVAKKAELKKSAKVTIQKEGKKVSGERMEKLEEVKSLVTSLGAMINSFMAEVQDQGDTDIQKEELDMKPEDLKKVFEETLAPVSKSIDDLAGRVKKMEDARTGEPVTPAPEATKADPVDDIKKAITEAIQPVSKSITDLADRVKKMEDQEQPSGKIEGQDTEVKKSGTKWPSFSGS